MLSSHTVFLSFVYTAVTEISILCCIRSVHATFAVVLKKQHVMIPYVKEMIDHLEIGTLHPVAYDLPAQLSKFYIIYNI